ncbi:TIM21-domain-containing protein [Lasiosphaeria miniovina]|uniref:Mitochondrial import inner membrane translocase subunit Tim21 n=1 Tax=Lasiosphaeria miniovina TaxID=1954250 RepID=A0AA39ZQI8_9PEZI|nr:TIM21-domain-containing protein [Lasiosphaeria miniovina]KAK0701802.1 TIM21-domain-containing protein [Lasiosphaeria miniovina]
MMSNRITASGLCAATTAKTSSILQRLVLQHSKRSLLLPPPPSYQRRHATTQNSGQEAAERRAVTPFNDDGHVPWTNLSAAEKTARAAQQTFNLGMVVVGLVLTGSVSYFLYTEVFSPDSKVAYFNRAVDRIKQDRRCLELLGDSKKITAFGEETNNKWRRARPIASTSSKDARGNEHLRIQFHVQGPKAAGAVHMHLIKRAGGSEFEYEYFFLDVEGQHRIYLENASAAAKAKAGAEGLNKPFRLFGVKWN